MKPKTILQKRVYELHKTLPKLTQEQTEWALNHCFKHYFIHRKSTGEYICTDCNHRWNSDVTPDVCPHCRATLTFCDNSRKKVFKDSNYYSVIQTCQEFTVIRVFYIDKYIKLGQDHNCGDFHEISQYWFSDDGGHVILSKNKLMNAYYSPMPFSLSSELTVKRTYEKYDYISPYQVYPKIQVSKAVNSVPVKSEVNRVIDLFYRCIIPEDGTL